MNSTCALARYDVEGSMAHIRMLESIGLLTKSELEVLLKGLGEIRAEIERGEFTIEPGVEDVHSQVEFILTERYGDIGKKFTQDAHATTRCLSTSNSSCATSSAR